jgi:hypothetical protein
VEFQRRCVLWLVSRQLFIGCSLSMHLCLSLIWSSITSSVGCCSVGDTTHSTCKQISGYMGKGSIIAMLLPPIILSLLYYTSIQVFKKMWYREGYSCRFVLNSDRNAVSCYRRVTDNSFCDFTNFYSLFAILRSENCSNFCPAGALYLLCPFLFGTAVQMHVSS